MKTEHYKNLDSSNFQKHASLKTKLPEPQEVVDYIYNIGNRISDVKMQLIQETKETFPGWAIMLTDPAEAELLKMMVKLTNCKRGIEIGVFTGYSSICMAEGLPDDGQLLCLDVSKEFTDLAIKYWNLANLSKKINLVLKPGVDVLDTLLKDNNNYKSYDFAFIDADKNNYINYYERLLQLIKPGGWIAFDNTLWSNKVVYEEEFNDIDTVELRKLNAILRTDERVEINMLPLADGVTIVRIK